MIISTINDLKKFFYSLYPFYKEEVIFNCKIDEFQIKDYQESKKYLGISLKCIIEEEKFEILLVDVTSINFSHSFWYSNSIVFDIETFRIKACDKGFVFEIQVENDIIPEDSDPLNIYFEKYYFDMEEINGE